MWPGLSSAAKGIFRGSYRTEKRVAEVEERQIWDSKSGNLSRAMDALQEWIMCYNMYLSVILFLNTFISVCGSGGKFMVLLRWITSI